MALTTESGAMTFTEEAAAFIAKGAANPDPERAAVYAVAAESVAATDILATALGVGDAAPMFVLPDAHGSMVSLDTLLANGPVIVSFYRGSWCPFCNIELRALQHELETAQAAGVSLVAISPNVPDESLGLIDKHQLTFPVLTDRNNEVARLFHLVYEMEQGLVEYYRDHDRDIASMNGSDVWELPVPATYVIDRAGIIRFAFVDLNHRVRAEPAEVVAIAASIS